MSSRAMIRIGDYFIVTGWNGDPQHLGKELANFRFSKTFPFLRSILGILRNYAVIAMSENLRKTEERKKTLSNYDLENVVDLGDFEGDIDYIYYIKYPLEVNETQLKKDSIRYSEGIKDLWSKHKKAIFDQDILWKRI